MAKFKMSGIFLYFFVVAVVVVCIFGSRIQIELANVASSVAQSKSVQKIPQNANDRLIRPIGQLGMQSVAAYGKQLLATLLLCMQRALLRLLLELLLLLVDSFLKFPSSGVKS